ncbi:hypothetical protein HDF16_001739 [Granulicella aggregans]|jgi:hypothetical protein|uniref:DUF6249 domain-containing protein n=1 Tax=Granulicella aggregans TaxID=474949 RepID=A0A7W7ZBW0_9BACT|nr:DUF6249 domain-containing protein [Granulicella aggregans]MBB5057054.1 hypothetical protein [Granulicella aggregans]
MLMEFENAFSSPFIVPVAAMIMVPAIVAVSKLSDYSTRKLQYEERMAAIAKGIPLPELPPMPMRSSFVNLQIRMGNVRRGGIVLVATGIGVATFFIVLAWILQERDVLSGAAAAIIPFAIGVGLLIDAWAQAREIGSSGLANGL